MVKNARNNIIGVLIFILLFSLIHYVFNRRPKVIFPTTTIAIANYKDWNWTPDGRIIYVKELVKPFIEIKTVIGIMDQDGNNDYVIKETTYTPLSVKKRLRVQQLKDVGIIGKIKLIFKESPEITADREARYGYFEGLFPDPPLSHVEYIDWNAKTNKIVFYANDPKNKYRIGMADPEFKNIDWIPIDKVSMPRLSPDGTRLAYISPEGLCILDLLSYSTTIVSKQASPYCWIPQGNGILTEDELYDFRPPKEVTRNNMIMLSRPAISPDGQWVIGKRCIFHLASLGHDNESWTLDKEINSPKFSPDGKSVIEGSREGIRIFDFKDGEVSNLRKVNQDQVFDEKWKNSFARLKRP